MISIDPKSPEAESTNTDSFELEKQLASPIDRLAAVVADFLLFSPVIAVLIAPFRKYAVQAELIGNKTGQAQAAIGAVFIALASLVVLRTICHAFLGATPGQRAMKLEVVSVWTGEYPKASEAFLRALLWCFDLICLAPLAAVYGDERRRPLHDRAADTVVITLNTARSAGVPTLPEMSIASGVQAAVLTVSVLILSARLLQPFGNDSTAVAAALEAEGKLCKDVGAALKEAPTSQTRLQTAMALFAAELLDKTCLEKEADLALWTETTTGEAYIAKALTTEGELRGKYLEKVCPRDQRNSALCGVIAFIEASDKMDFEDDGTEESKIERTNAETDLELMATAIDSTTPVYMKIWAVTYSLSVHQYARAQSLLNDIPAQSALGPFLARERTRAFWEAGQAEQSRTAFQSSLPLLKTAERTDFARWFCREETAGGTCTEESLIPCEALRDAVIANPDLANENGVSGVYVRAEICHARGRISTDAATRISDVIPESTGRDFVEAITKLDGKERTKALDLLETVATGPDGDDPFYLEANLKLADLAKTDEDLESIAKRWSALDDDANAKRDLGIKLITRFGDLGNWKRALDTGLRLAFSSPEDPVTSKFVVVAAYHSGQMQVAQQYLSKIEGDSSREPASVDDFAEIAKRVRTVITNGEAP